MISVNIFQLAVATRFTEKESWTSGWIIKNGSVNWISWCI